MNAFHNVNTMPASHNQRGRQEQMTSFSSFTITDADAAIIRAPLATPFRIATGQHDELANVFLRLRTGDSLCGYGEAAVATHITGETVPQTLANLQAAAAALEGRTIADPEAACREFAPVFAGNRAGLAAVEMALLDLAARVQGVPLYQLFAAAAAPPRD
jgi:L-alanine-DL-glutamate epimerase-like enolase superfamily enzyme